MDGIINILKPPGMTSFDVVSYLRGILKTKKIGHTGTLDPGAVGVLPICVGSATKAIEFMIEKDKVYRAELTLGVSTDTQDSTGQVLSTRNVNVMSEEIREVMKEFVGHIKQTPPMYSAIKVDGKRLYELARSGITIEREPREIEIYFLNIIKITTESLEMNRTGIKVLFDVGCSKGTYIRTLCSDIGDRLGCGGHMSFLVRLKAGAFDIKSSITLEKLAEFAETNQLHSCFTEIDLIFKDYRSICLNPFSEKKLLQGAFIAIDDQDLSEGQIVRVYNEAGRFFALGEVFIAQGKTTLKSKKQFNM